MPGTPEALYDAHAARLYAYCWSLVGDGAEEAVRDTFVAATKHPPRGDAVLWLYALARSTCMDRGALDRAFHPGRLGAPDDPLLWAAAGLRADHREVLLLAAGEWLDLPDIAVVLGVAADTARQLLQVARTRLDRAVLDLLMRRPGSRYDAELIAAFEKGALPRTLARRAPDRPPHRLRAHVLAACAAERERPLSTVTATSPLVVIGSAAAGRPAANRRRAKGLSAVAGLAASAAATVGMVAAWAGAKGGGAGFDALGPITGQGGPSTAQSVPVNSPTTATSRPTDPGAPANGGAPSVAGPQNSTSDPYVSQPYGGSPYGGAPTAPQPPSRTAPPTTTAPANPQTPTVPAPGDTGAPAPTEPTTPPPTDPPVTEPPAPSTPVETPVDPPVDVPDPTSNPSPQPSQEG
ncbi:RNA polymerase sigma factor [Thermomonospora cellulosilytica]|uniref:DNA-directed RNA polymerase specialized sigma24 family protein n=1 Tax=Thermomonospora cellulosilytica TaxID=1411118 RepID=A0A7W3N4I5_9ACTN|nr:RNA polymerase sigma factor [Thermomonospora cellulosilytica]MBA9007401.1 DNA-directed RNA polymerase specialized sigma24 family protein [Thermomonospora cellulosilytica]